MPTTIAIMSGSLLISFALIIINKLGITDIAWHLGIFLKHLDFSSLLMNGMLSFLLFAGALNVDVSYLKSQKWEIATLAGIGTIISTIAIGFLAYYTLQLIGIKLRLIDCMLFGALISPTDPIAVLATFKELNAPRALDIKVAGESLFNDGVGIVLFLTLYHLATAGTTITMKSVSLLFFQQAIGGIIYGMVVGIIAYNLIRSTEDSKIQILLTLVVVTGGYTLARALDISGPLAMVVAGIFIGNRGRKFNTKSQEHLEVFWELIDEVLNAILFLLIGFELLTIHANKYEISAAILAIPMVLLARWVTVAIPMSVFKIWRKYSPYAITIMVWGGLRGGLAVALALSLPSGSPRNLFLVMTYAVVMFSIIVQGLTTKPLVTLCREELRRQKNN